MAKVVYDENVELWRIRDGRTKNVLTTNDHKAVDRGGQRTEIDAYRLLKAFSESQAKKQKKKQ